jgi:hypothetical protein
MDSANQNTTRKYPSYTTAQLEASVAAGRGNDVMIEEIARRKAGLSVAQITPQLLGGKAVVKVGRM